MQGNPFQIINNVETYKVNFYTCIYCEGTLKDGKLIESVSFSKHMKTAHQDIVALINQSEKFVPKQDRDFRLSDNFTVKHRKKRDRKNKNKINQNLQNILHEPFEDDNDEMEKEEDDYGISMQFQNIKQQFDNMIDTNSKKTTKVNDTYDYQLNEIQDLTIKEMQGMINHLIDYCDQVTKGDLMNKNLIKKYKKTLNAKNYQQQQNRIDACIKYDFKIEFSTSDMEKTLNELQILYENDIDKTELSRYHFIKQGMMYMHEQLLNYTRFFSYILDDNLSKNNTPDEPKNEQPFNDKKQQVQEDIKLYKEIEKQYLHAYNYKERQINPRIRENKQLRKIGICSDIKKPTLFQYLAAAQMNHAGRLFDVVTIDYPWDINQKNKKNQDFIPYQTMKDTELFNIPIKQIQKQGYLFLWIVNSKLLEGLEFLRRNGYKYVDQYTYVKMKNETQLGDGHGYYLRHCKETCLIGLKGGVPSIDTLHKVKDVCLMKKPEHSRKPEDIYLVAETLWPNGCYLELFGRKHNLRNGWVTVGNQL